MGIFEPFRAIGYITSTVPFSVQRLGTETFVTVSVGKAWQIYNVLSLSPYIHTLVWKLGFKILFFLLLLCILSSQTEDRGLKCAKLNLVLVGKALLILAHNSANHHLCLYTYC
ncbi:hypothetical protein CK203_074886 [Vitis vinifera]|uniref:Uncharacterized protein n=1 Tax=Vitis vinifera TaxID=29760 RepID=A0A438DE57_VITVI|nr:hypothetical protein CK203_074886 [Vitis vinifera]